MREKNEIKISVIIPYYNYLDWLIEALHSVNKQTFNNFEVIVVNDGSQDDVEEVLSKESFKFTLTIINKQNGGPASARNFGIRASKGEYIAFLDSDDLWMEDKLTVQYLAMIESGFKWSQHSYVYFYENGKEKLIDTSSYALDPYVDTFISFKVQTSCIMVKRDVLIDENNEQIIYFPENQRYGQDNFFYRELSKKYQMLSIPNVLSRFRIRGNNAGLRPSVQLMSKARILAAQENGEMKNNKELPKIVYLVYKLCAFNYRLWKKLPKKLANEFSAGIFYILPYLLLKISYKVRKNK
ncbi:glycosyltransferase family 2 protein [Enterococcus rotai]|uniref:glycosyltransferase family 2 protein n=1 Tax=Enterococcus rotai TaxID=118060 RepID=UPI0032B36435